MSTLKKRNTGVRRQETEWGKAGSFFVATAGGVGNYPQTSPGVLIVQESIFHSMYAA